MISYTTIHTPLRRSEPAAAVVAVDLRPEAVPLADEAEERSTDVDGLRLELSGHPALRELFGRVELGDAPADLHQMRSEVDHAWQLAHESRYASLNDALTELLPREEQGRAEARPGTTHEARAEGEQTDYRRGRSES